MSQVQVPEQSASGASETVLAQPLSAAEAAAATVSPRQCGRCRLLFEGDETLSVTAQPEWWLCASCRTTLLGK